MIVLIGLALYAAAGVAIGIAFVASRAGRPRRGRSRSAAATAGHTGGDQV
jgi:hypothetical protein